MSQLEGREKFCFVSFVIAVVCYSSLAERESLLRKIQSIAVKDTQENHNPEWLSQWTGPA